MYKGYVEAIYKSELCNFNSALLILFSLDDLIFITKCQRENNFVFTDSINEGGDH